MFTFNLRGPKSPRTRQQRIQELLRKASCETNKYNIGGQVKEGKRKPRPITLPKVSITE